MTSPKTVAVPVEPTPQMIDAALEKVSYLYPNGAIAAYKAMIAAAPQENANVGLEKKIYTKKDVEALCAIAVAAAKRDQ